MIKAVKDFVRKEILVPVVDTIKKEFKEQVAEHLPLIVDVIVRTITESSIKLAAEGADKLTDMIPGELDDQIIDPIAKQITDRLGELYRSLGGAR